jgi:hypothetical protein
VAGDGIHGRFNIRGIKGAQPFVAICAADLSVSAVGRWGVLKRALVAATAGMVLVGLAGAAYAQSCQALRAELARLESAMSMGQADQAARYDRALREQTRVFAQTQNEARRAGCLNRGFLFFRSRPQPVCRSLMPRLHEMEANMMRLRQLRDQHARGGDLRRIEEIRRALQRGHCYDDRGGFADGFARGPWGGYRPGPYEAYPQEELRAPGDYLRRDTAVYRTVCVRKCDGYYFPISFSTTPENFYRDRGVCQAMCPAAEAELYYHPDPTSDPPDMYSLSGQAYSQLANAYRHRKEYDPSCTCGRPQAPPMSVASLTTSERVPAGSIATVPKLLQARGLPTPRVGPAEDPETVAARAGGFVIDSLGGQVGPTGAGDRSVRIVGPSYWGTQQHDDILLMSVPN